MGTYNIPRNVKGEGRILFIFSIKALIYSIIGLVLGLPFYWIFSALEITVVGIIIMVILALIGFAIGTFKLPEFAGLKFTKKIGGEPLSEIILRWIKFKKNKKMYVYTKEEK